MKTPRTIQTKRTRPKTGFRMLHAATRASKKRKQRAATTANPEDLGEVPGVGVPLALVVILLLHIAAIAGIWIHDRWSSSADLSASKPALKENVQPARIPELDFHLVNSGQTAEIIAGRYGVTVEALSKVNDGIVDYEAGWKINIPFRPTENVSSNEAVVGAGIEAVVLPIPTQTERPVIQTSDDVSIPGSVPGVGVEIGTPVAESGRTEDAVLIRPLTPVRPETRNPGAVAPAAMRRHVVQSGETLWRIATNNGISVAELQGANPGVSASALKIGLALNIPAKR